MNNRELWILVVCIAIAFLSVCICTSLYGMYLDTMKRNKLSDNHYINEQQQNENENENASKLKVKVDVVKSMHPVDTSQTVQIHGTPIGDYGASPSSDPPKRVELEVVNSYSIANANGNVIDENHYQSENAKRLAKFNDNLIVETVVNVASPITPPNDSEFAAPYANMDQ